MWWVAVLKGMHLGVKLMGMVVMMSSSPTWETPRYAYGNCLEGIIEWEDTPTVVSTIPWDESWTVKVSSNKEFT